MDPISPAHDPELLLEHSDWVRALARTLVRDSSTAEDVAQETWLAALQHPPGGDRPARAWLAAVVKNAARQLGRSEERRIRRERGGARREALPSDDELGERVALQQWVVGEVMALDEPYRRTILLRFFEGLPPREIATRMGVPLETVKSRLQRALARLRERMSAKRGPGGASGVLALLPLVSSGPGSAVAGAGVVLMGKKGLLLAAAALMLLFGGALYVALSEPTDPVTIAPIAERSDGEGGAAAELPVTVAVEPALPAVAETAEERAPGLGGEELFRIRTVERDSGRPVADAQVWIVPWAEVVERDHYDGMGDSFDIEAAVAALGSALHTDDQGELRLPVSDEYTLAVARHGKLFGRATNKVGSGETWEIPLLIDRSITIQTVTEGGEPIAGIPVAIAQCDPGSSPDSQWWAHTRGEEGQITLHHVDHTLEWDLQTGVTWSATLATPWPDPPTVHLDPRDLPTEAVRLVVGAGGRVTVRIEDEQGEPLPAGWIYLSEVRAHRDAVGRSTRPMRHNRYDREGRANYENVAPGLELRAGVSPPGYRRQERLFRSPVAPGEETIVEFSFSERYPVITATLVDPTDTPLARRAIDVQARLVGAGENDNALTGRSRTDAEGGFSESLSTSDASDAFQEIAFTTDEAYEGETLAATVRVTDPPPDGVYDLGRVVLEPPPVVLSGRVVDARGEPIFWAGISVKRMTGTNGVGGPAYYWVPEWHTQTRQDGSFQLTGDHGPGDYRLLVDGDRDGYLNQDDIPFQPGTHGLEIVLHQAGGLEGSLCLPEDVPPSWLRVSLNREDLAEGSRREGVIPHPDGKFFLQDLAPGEFDVTVFLPAWPEPLVCITDVWVEGGVTRAAPRLTNLDLTAAIHRLDLELRDPEGAPVPIGCIAFWSPDGSESRVAFTNGAASLITPTPTANVEVIAPGFRPRRVDGARDGMRIDLERGIPVRLKLPDGFDLPDPPTRLSVELVPARMESPEERQYVYADDGSMTERWDRRQYGVAATFTDSLEVTLEVGSPGEWQISWSISAEQWRSGLRGARGLSGTIEVAEPGPSEAIERAPDAEALERRLADRE